MNTESWLSLTLVLLAIGVRVWPPTRRWAPRHRRTPAACPGSAVRREHRGRTTVAP